MTTWLIPSSESPRIGYPIGTPKNYPKRARFIGNSDDVPCFHGARQEVPLLTARSGCIHGDLFVSGIHNPLQYHQITVSQVCSKHVN